MDGIFEFVIHAANTFSLLESHKYTFYAFSSCWNLLDKLKANLFSAYTYIYTLQVAMN